jgi:putative endonuclease
MPYGRLYFVYIMASASGTICVGVTSNICNRTYEHRSGRFPDCFTSKYKIYKLVWWQSFYEITEAIAREKQIKGWRREKKRNLIEQRNPLWLDLYESALQEYLFDS